jgi:hypothetical protein
VADLDEEELRYTDSGDCFTKEYADELMARMAAEIRRRRAADLSDEDREALRVVLRMVASSPDKPQSVDVYMQIRRLLDRLIGDKQ